MISVIRYNDSHFNIWNDFNSKSKNHLFMFDRNYMDYHKDRFIDHSLMFYDDNKLIALLPLSVHGDVVISHGGLTYGGFITGEKMKQHTMNDCFFVLRSYLKENGFTKIRYKCIPHIYSNQSAEEDRFALFLNNAELETIDVSTYVNLNDPYKMPKGRKAQVSRAKREGVVIKELCNIEDFDRFIELENEVLQTRHDVTAAHSGKELKLLHDRFPNNIKLIVAELNNELIAGTVIYIYDNVVHTQYMASNEIARQIGGLDLIIKSIIDYFADKKLWLDFGISTEHGRIYLNEGLCSQKESFGGRTGVYEIWGMKL